MDLGEEIAALACFMFSAMVIAGMLFGPRETAVALVRLAVQFFIWGNVATTVAIGTVMFVSWRLCRKEAIRTIRG